MGLDNPIHILLLLLVVLLVFGAKRLPEIGRSLGEGMRGFKETIHGASQSTALPSDPTMPAMTPVPSAPAAAVHPLEAAPRDSAA